MLLQVLKSKIHCATVTEANLQYMGSITIDEQLMEATGMLEGEMVHVVNNSNGEISARDRWIEIGRASCRERV